LRSFYNYPGLLLSLTSLFWAGNVVLGRAVAGMIPPVSLACLRWAIASLLLMPFAWPYLRKDWRLIAKSWKIMLFLGIVGPGFYNTLSYLGLVQTEALNGLVLSAAGPMLIALAAWSIFGDPLPPAQLASLATGFIGVLFIVSRGDLSSLAALRINPGDGLLLAGLLMWSIYTAFFRKRPAVSWQSFNAVSYSVAALANLPFVIAEQYYGHVVMSWSPATIAAVSYTAIFPSLVAYIFYNRGVELLGPARAGLYFFLVPVFGALLATVFLGEQLHAYHAAGFALIIAGVVAGTWRPRNAGAASAGSAGD
jgi:drug/metabolite transporter (DMT)-like permease